MYKKLSAASLIVVLLGCAASTSSNKGVIRNIGSEKLKIKILEPMLNYGDLDKGLNEAKASLRLEWETRNIDLSNLSYEVELYEVDNNDTILRSVKKLETKLPNIEVNNLEVGKRYNAVVKRIKDSSSFIVETTIATIPQAQLDIEEKELGGGVIIKFRDTYEGIKYYLDNRELVEVQLEKGYSRNTSVMLEESLVISFFEELNGVRSNPRLIPIKVSNKKYLESVKNAKTIIQRLRKGLAISAHDALTLVTHWEVQYNHITGVIFSLRRDNYIPSLVQTFDDKIKVLKENYEEIVKSLRPLVSYDKLSSDDNSQAAKVIEKINNYEKLRNEICSDIYKYCVGHNESLEILLKDVYNFDIKPSFDNEDTNGISLTHHKFYKEVKKFFKEKRKLKLSEFLDKQQDFVSKGLISLLKDLHNAKIFEPLLNEKDPIIKNTAIKLKSLIEDIYKDACSFDKINYYEIATNEQVIDLLKNKVLPFILKYNRLCEVFEVENCAIVSLEFKLEGTNGKKSHKIYPDVYEFINHLKHKLRDHVNEIKIESLNKSFDEEEAVKMIESFYKKQFKKELSILECIPGLYNSELINQLLEISSEYDDLYNVNTQVKNIRTVEIICLYKKLFNLLNDTKLRLEFPSSLTNFMIPLKTEALFAEENTQLNLKDFLKKVLEGLELDKIEDRTSVRQTNLRRSGSRENVRVDLADFREIDYNLKEVLKEILDNYRSKKKELSKDEKTNVKALTENENKVLKKILKKLSDGLLTKTKEKSTIKLKGTLEIIKKYLNPNLTKSPEKEKSISRSNSKGSIVY